MSDGQDVPSQTPAPVAAPAAEPAPASTTTSGVTASTPSGSAPSGTTSATTQSGTRSSSAPSGATLVPPTGQTPLPIQLTDTPTGQEAEARFRISALEREARAMGSVPAAALLFHEIGLLWEHRLKHPRNAAISYQAAFRLAPKFLANIRAARRLFAEVGNWAMVIQLIDAEINSTDALRAKAALLFEKGQILDQRLQKEADAQAAIQQCLSLEPQDVTLLVQLEQVFTERGEWETLIRVYKQLAAAVTDNSARSHYLTSAGLLLEDRLNNIAAATEIFRRAFELDRRDPQLLAAMKRVSHREETIDEELATLAAEAEGQGAFAAPTFLQIARTYERLGRIEDALAALVAARRTNPNDQLILSELSRLYEIQERYEELAEVLTTRSDTNTDETEFITINLRLASILEDQLRRIPEAVARYKAILDRVPGHAAALAGLGKVYFRTQNWAGLLATYDAEANAINDPQQKANRLYKAGETLEERLGKVEDAIDRYNQCLLLQPGFLPAQKSLTRLYERLGRWAELISMYESEALLLSDKEEQSALLYKVASLYEDRLNDIPAAIDTLKRILDLNGEHVPTLRMLSRLYERTGIWDLLLELNDREARVTTDTKQIVSLAHRNAEILEEHLRDRPAAIAAWERVLQLSPNYLPALRALGRLYGQDGKWDELIRMYRAEAEVEPSTEHAAGLIYKIGELHEQKQKNMNDAISAYREVLTLAPSHAPALRALARIYRQQESWENLIEILHAEAANRTDPLERANAMFQAATIWEDQLKKPDQALSGYQEVLRLAPTHSTAMQQLERLLTSKDDLKELVLLLDRQTQMGASVGRVSAWLKLARLYLERLNEPTRAAAACESALALDGSNLAALRLLERIKANDKAKRVELRARIAEAIGDSKLAAAIRLSAQATLDPRGEQLLEQLKTAFETDPTDEALGLVLERALERVGDAAGLVTIYERRRATTTDSADMLQLLLRIAELQEQRLHDYEKAIVAYETALQSTPDLYPALVGLARSLDNAGKHARAIEVLERISELSKDPASGLESLMEAAKIARDRLKDVDLAASLFKKVLDRSPLHPEAGPALEELLAQRGGSADLAKMHERRAEAKVTQRDAAAGAHEYFLAAKIYLDTLHDRDAGTRALDNALMTNPTFPDALELKGNLALEDKNFAEAAAAFAVRIQQGGEAKALAQVHLKLGALYHDHLSDQTRATAHLQTALASDPNQVEALERLATIHTLSQNWTAAADCLRRLLELANDSHDRARHTIALARIIEDGFADISQAIALYRKAMELVPNDTAAFDRLIGLYERNALWADLVAMLDQQAQLAHDVKKAIGLKMRVGHIYATSLEALPKAAETYKNIIQVDATYVPALAALAEVYSRDTTTAMMAIETHRSILRLEPTRIESVRSLFKLWESLRQVDKAFCAASVLSFMKVANEAERTFLAEQRDRLPHDLRGPLGPADVVAMHHPDARNALVDVLRAIGDQGAKFFPPAFERLGVDRRADRIKADHAVAKAFHAVGALFQLPLDLEIVLAKRGFASVETTDPLTVVFNQELFRKYSLREQRFLFGRIAMGVYDKTAVIHKAPANEIADFIGNAIRILQPDLPTVGKRNDEQTKQLKKAFSRRSLKELEEPADAVRHLPHTNAEATIHGLLASENRAGLVACGDVALGMTLLLRDEPDRAELRLDTSTQVSFAVQQRPDVRELIHFAVSEDFFRLRQRVGLSLG